MGFYGSSIALNLLHETGKCLLPPRHTLQCVLVVYYLGTSSHSFFLYTLFFFASGKIPANQCFGKKTIFIWNNTPPKHLRISLDYSCNVTFCIDQSNILPDSSQPILDC